MEPVVIINYAGESLDLDLGSMRIVEAEECEQLTGWTHPEWKAALREDRARAVAFAWYLACKRAGQDVTFAAVREGFDMGKVEYSVRPVDDDSEQAPPDLGVGDDDEAPSSPASQAGEPSVPESDPK